MANKLKSRTSAAKRFKVTGTGRIMRRQAGKSHLLTKKSRRRKRNMSVETGLARVDRQNVARQILP
jgi:large subunit ribosomal protein L35